MNYNWCLGTFVIAVMAAASKSIGRGFGEQYIWFGLEEGLEAAKNSNKPLMLIIHKTWCGACKALKPQFAASKEIEDLSSHFVMVNVEDDEEPKDEQYSPDGGYVPRILFIEPTGKVRTDFFNVEGNPSYKYFYSDTESVAATMIKVKNSMKSDGRMIEEL
jgi:protein-disulfide reductase (glutathione)